MAKLLDMFEEIGIPAAKYNELPEVWEEEQVKFRKLRATTPHPHAEAGSVDLIASPLAQMSASPATIRLPAAAAGRTYRRGVAANCSAMSAEQIAALRESKII